MKKTLKSLMPQAVSPVQRGTAATVSRDGSAIAPKSTCYDGDIQCVLAMFEFGFDPFAGDDAE